MVTPGAASSSILPSLCSPLSDTNPPAGPSCSWALLEQLLAHSSPLPSPQPGHSSSTATAEQPHPKGIRVPREFCSCSKPRGLVPSLPSKQQQVCTRCSQRPPLPRQAEGGAPTRSLLSFPPAGNAATAGAAPNQGRGIPRGRGRIREGAEFPLGIPGTTTWGRKMQVGHSAGEDRQTVKVAIPRHHFSPLISLH